MYVLFMCRICYERKICYLCINYIFLYHVFIFSQLWLTSHPRSTVVLLDTGTPGTSREVYSEDADDGTPTRNSSKAIAGKDGQSTRFITEGLRV